MRTVIRSLRVKSDRLVIVLVRDNLRTYSKPRDLRSMNESLGTALHYITIKYTTLYWSQSCEGAVDPENWESRLH